MYERKEEASFLPMDLKLNNQLRCTDYKKMFYFTRLQGPFNKYRDWFQKSKFIAGIITIT